MSECTDLTYYQRNQDVIIIELKIIMKMIKRD